MPLFALLRSNRIPFLPACLPVRTYTLTRRRRARADEYTRGTLVYGRIKPTNVCARRRTCTYETLIIIITFRGPTLVTNRQLRPSDSQ